MSVHLPELKHHSASTINSFLTNRAQWYRNKIIGDKFQGSEHTARGTAVEAGINHWLSGDTDATVESVKHAISIWDKEIGYFDPKLDPDKELEFKQTLAPLVNAGIKSVKERYSEKYNRELVQQYKIAVDVPGCQFPALGYLDWIIPDTLVIDNKVTGKTPSKLSQNYIVQGAVYVKATKLPVEFHFEVALKTPKCVVIRITEEEVEYGWKLFCRACRAIEAIFAAPLDGELMENLFLANPDSFYNQKDINKALEDFGF